VLAWFKRLSGKKLKYPCTHKQGSMKDVEFTKTQALIGKSLLKSSKKLPTLSEELGVKEDVLKKELAPLMASGVVLVRRGKLSLAPEVRRAFQKKSEEKGEKKFKAHWIIEGISRDKESLEKANKALIKKMEEDKRAQFYNLVEEEMIKEGDNYSVLLEGDVSTGNFEDMVYAVLTYGPVSIELEEPPEFELERQDAQGVLMDTASVLNHYVQIVQKLEMDRDIIIK
jgi:hypothetical protein